MFISEIKNDLSALDTSRKSLRNFGILVGAVFLALSWWLLHPLFHVVTIPGLTIFSTGALLVLTGFFSPLFLRKPYFVWMALALVLGFVMTRLILTAVFVLVVLPIGLVLRLAGKDPLDRKWDRSANSYWRIKEYRDPSAKRLEKLF